MNNDAQFEEVVIEKVSEVLSEDDVRVRAWDILRADGWSFRVPNQHDFPAPKVGEVARFYGDGIGRPVRGFSIVYLEGERVYFYETEAEYDERSRRERAEEKARTVEKFAAKIDEFNDAVFALPEPFRKRMSYFLANPEWAAEFGNYELFCCQEAVKIADGVRAQMHLDIPIGDAIRAFHEMGSEKQFRTIPGLSHDHSGNTFGTACLLAKVYAEQPDLLPMVHGALCPLVGCEAYGCHAARTAVEP